jgi:4-hydroxy-2-oxoheptanedioate aldolase
LKLGVNLKDKYSLKEKLKQGKPVIGTWNTLASPLATEVIAQGGFDFQIIDLEHGPFILDQIHLHVLACEAAGVCTPIVRVPRCEDWMVQQAMDQGAQGIIIPHVSNKKSAQDFISALKYYPSGIRGISPFTKAGGFNNNNIINYVGSSNSESLAIIIIESKEGLERLDEILEVKDIDVVYFGAYDLSQELGYPGDVRHPEVIRTIRKSVDVVVKHGRSAGGFVPQTKDDIQWLLDMGMRFITYEVDSSILYTHVRNINDWFEKETT